MPYFPCFLLSESDPFLFGHNPIIRITTIPAAIKASRACLESVKSISGRNFLRAKIPIIIIASPIKTGRRYFKASQITPSVVKLFPTSNVKSIGLWITALDRL